MSAAERLATGDLNVELVASSTDEVGELVRIKDGRLRKGQKILMMGAGAVYEVDEVGVFAYIVCAFR